MTDSAIGGVPTSGTDVAGDDDRSTTNGAPTDGPVIEGVLEDAPGTGESSDGSGADDYAGTSGTDELDRLRSQLTERTADLQRLQAEYANYRRRVERDREATVAGAKASVASELLTVLDDVQRAEAHGDLTGPFKVVADRLTETLHRAGLEPFGSEGDAFDPAVHEAVAQETSAEVSGPTVTTVMRRGYRFGEKLLRPAMVAVTDHDPDAAPSTDPPEGWAAASPGATNPDAV